LHPTKPQAVEVSQPKEAREAHAKEAAAAATTNKQEEMKCGVAVLIH